MEPVRSENNEQILPDGTKWNFREQNGDDDAILSTIADNQSGDSVHKFLAAITVGMDGKKVRLTHQEIKKWKSRNIISALIKSRIYSLGPIVKFLHTCSDPNCKFTPEDDLAYEEDLTLYDWDYGKPVPDKFLDKDRKEPNPFYSKFRIPAYAPGLEDKEGYINLILSSKKEVRYKYQDGEGEKVFLDTPQAELNNTLQLLSRSIEWKNETGQFIRLQNFKVFTAKDMSEIRTHISKNDIPYDALCEIHCPRCKKVDVLNIMYQPPFFYPLGT